MLSGHNDQGVHAFTLRQQTQDFANVVNQGIPRGKLYPRLQLQEAATTSAAETIARKVVEKKERGGRTMNAAESHDSTIMYLVMPSYAEPYKKEIKQILLKEKRNLCSSKTFQKVFEDIDFNIAFSNSKNIKQMLVRTKA